MNNLNGLYQKASEALESGDHSTFVGLTQAIKFNGGGHVNHEIFWESMAPVGQGGGEMPAPGSPLEKALSQAFGSVDGFIEHFNANTAAVQGSGWGWLAYNKTSGELQFTTTSNQDTLGGNLVPLLGIDVWEHAYYIDYRNVRPNYLKAIWGVINWPKVAEKYLAASA